MYVWARRCLWTQHGPITLMLEELQNPRSALSRGAGRRSSGAEGGRGWVPRGGPGSSGGVPWHCWSLGSLRACLGVGVVLDEDDRCKHFGLGVEAHIACPTPWVAAPKTQLSFGRAWLAAACPSPAGARSTPRHVPSPCTPGQGQEPRWGDLFQERTTHRRWAIMCLFPGPLLFNTSSYKRRDSEILVQLLSRHDGAHCRQTSRYTEPQNSGGWKGPNGSSGPTPCPGRVTQSRLHRTSSRRVWVSPEKETPQPLWAAWSRAPSPSEGRSSSSSSAGASSASVCAHCGAGQKPPPKERVMEEKLTTTLPAAGALRQKPLWKTKNRLH